MKDLKLLPESSPEVQGVDPGSIYAFFDEIKRLKLGMHSILILRNGHVIAKNWWKPYRADIPHMIYSVTKSFTSAAVGFAVKEKLLSIDDPLLYYFPEYSSLEIKKKFDAVCIKHLLTMSLGNTSKLIGRKYDGDIPVDGVIRYLGERNDGNWIKGFFESELQVAPGTRFSYDDGVSYMLSAVILRATKEHITKYLGERLFDRLGIERPFWERCPSGIALGGYGLKLRTEEMACFGQLYLQKGIWRGQEILDPEWIKESSACHINADSANFNIPVSERPDWAQYYGYHIWNYKNKGFYAYGALGQFIIVLPDMNAVIAITGGFYEYRTLFELLEKFLIPGILFKPVRMMRCNVVSDQTDMMFDIEIKNRVSTSDIAAAVDSKSFLIEENQDRLKSVEFNFGEELSRIIWRDHKGEHHIVCGMGKWIDSESKFLGETYSANGGWESRSTFAVSLCFLETPYNDTIFFSFDKKKIDIVYTRKVTCCPRDPIHFTGSTL